MTLDDIVSGFEKALELERELGVKSFELDRALLDPLEVSSAIEKVGTGKKEMQRPLDKETLPVRPEAPKRQPPVREAVLDFVFVHDKPLSQKAQGMMEKAIVALGSTKDKSPVVCGGAIPPARMYVFLGAEAARKFMPTVNFTIGDILTSPGGKKFVVTHSPEQIIRFSGMERIEMKMKKELWGHINVAVKAVNVNRQ